MIVQVMFFVFCFSIQPVKHLLLLSILMFFQVVSVNNTRKKVTVKLIPRIDLQALAAKFVMRPLSS